MTGEKPTGKVEDLVELVRFADSDDEDRTATLVERLLRNTTLLLDAGDAASAADEYLCALERLELLLDGGDPLAASAANENAGPGRMRRG